MSFIPNTTPTPNWLYNGEMKKMSDVELRVVLVVTRHTLGWIENEITGMRKQEDWISHSLLIKETGKSSRAISSAIDKCVKHGWIETRDKQDNVLVTSNEKRRQRIFYRLGNVFTDKLKSTANNAIDDNLPQSTTKSTANDDTNLPQKRRNTKETLTKETIQKKETSIANSDEFADKLNPLIDLFKGVNPNHTELFRNITQRNALSWLVEKHGYEKIKQVIISLPEIICQKYAPTITTPFQLKNKLPELVAFIRKNRAKSIIAPAFQKNENH